MKLLVAGALIALTSVITPAMAAGDAAAGEIKAQNCLGCHGDSRVVNIYPTYHVPKIGGQHAAYIVSALKAYANGSRNHGTMTPQAMAMSEQDMQDIAAYVSAMGSK